MCKLYKVVKYGMGAKEVVANNINRLLAERGVSQADLARAIDCEPLTIHYYTKGKRFPKPESMDAICRYFNIPLTDLFKNPDERPSVDDALEVVAASHGYELKRKE